MGLRFGILARVSTVAQKQHGESLTTQVSQLENAVNRVGGVIVKRYTVQEHASPGCQRNSLKMILTDINAKEINAVMVADVSRLARDVEESSKFYKSLKRANARFFVLGTEYDLDDSTHNCMLTIFGSFAQLQSAVQAEKSLINKIALAEKGEPSSGGNLPYGRTFSKDKGWGVDLEKQSIMLDVAERIVNENWSTVKAALYCGMLPSVLSKRLKTLGSSWFQRFHSKNLNIHRDIPMSVPELIPRELNERLLAKLSSNRAYLRDGLKYQYLLSRKVYHRPTSFTLVGQTTFDNGKSYRYYRSQGDHIRAGHYFSVRADRIEGAVLSALSEVINSDKRFFESVLKQPADPSVIDDIKMKISTATKSADRIKKEIERRAQYIPLESDSSLNITRAIFLEKMKELETEFKRQVELLSSLRVELAKCQNTSSIKGKRKEYKAELLRLIHYNYLNSHLALAGVDYLYQRRVIDLMLGGEDEHGRKYGVYVDGSPNDKDGIRFEVYGYFGTVIVKDIASDDYYFRNFSQFEASTVSQISNIILDGYACYDTRDDILPSNSESSPPRTPAYRRGGR